jgi:hypothetical protein
MPKMRKLNKKIHLGRQKVVLIVAIIHFPLGWRELSPLIWKISDMCDPPAWFIGAERKELGCGSAAHCFFFCSYINNESNSARRRVCMMHLMKVDDPLPPPPLCSALAQTTLELPMENIAPAEQRCSHATFYLAVCGARRTHFLAAAVAAAPSDARHNCADAPAPPHQNTQSLLFLIFVSDCATRDFQEIN